MEQARQRTFLCRIGPTKFMSACEPLYSKEDLDAIIKLLYNISSIEYNGPIKTGDPVNKRILELMEQATTVTEPNDPDFRHESFNRAKFAQLIVRECMDLALGSSHRDDDMGAIIANKIKEHFGVSE